MLTNEGVGLRWYHSINSISNYGDALLMTTHLQMRRLRKIALYCKIFTFVPFSLLLYSILTFNTSYYSKFSSIFKSTIKYQMYSNALCHSVLLLFCF